MPPFKQAPSSVSNQEQQVKQEVNPFLKSKIDYFLSGISITYSDGRTQKIPAMWDVSGYIFGNEGTFIEHVFSSTEKEDFSFDDFISNPEVFVKVKEGILHFITKGYIDRRLVDFIGKLPKDLVKKLSPELKEAMEEIIEKDGSYNPELPLSTNNHKYGHNMDSVRKILEIIS